ncbi:hypothetical protein Ancab_013153 [Ancistrocladus abbreviatus]
MTPQSQDDLIAKIAVQTIQIAVATDSEASLGMTRGHNEGISSRPPCCLPISDLTSGKRISVGNLISKNKVLSTRNSRHKL